MLLWSFDVKFHSFVLLYLEGKSTVGQKYSVLLYLEGKSVQRQRALQFSSSRPSVLLGDAAHGQGVVSLLAKLLGGGV